MAPDPFRTDHAPVIGGVEDVAPGVRAVTAGNGGPMTFTGTRSYIVGQGEVALIDPGPADRAHHAAILGALGPGERIAAVFVTHSHADHSPLAAAFGAPVHAFGPHGAGLRPGLAALGPALGGGEGADAAFAPDRILQDDSTVEGAGWALTALHTPGHLSNHLSFVLEGTGIVFTGDHVMGWATTLISPPDGDLTAFMASLRRMAMRDDHRYLPGHGAPVEDPRAVLTHILAHRAGREAQIRAALADGPATPAALTARIYAGLDPRLHGAAARNVLAHLIDLCERGIVSAPGGIAADARFALSQTAV